jgi:SOS response regulatory protein OraA/RecX
MKQNNKQKIKQLDSLDLVRAAALRYLSRRDYTAKELSQYLQRRGAADKDVDEVITALKTNGALDEARLAMSWVRYRKEYSPHGRAYIRRELLKRGADSSVIVAAIEEQYTEEDERQVVSNLIKRMCMSKAKDTGDTLEEKKEAYKFRQKLARRLMAKGFAQDLIISEINNIWVEEEN